MKRTGKKYTLHPSPISKDAQMHKEPKILADVDNVDSASTETMIDNGDAGEWEWECSFQTKWRE